jgi:hypothetical protein
MDCIAQWRRDAGPLTCHGITRNIQYLPYQIYLPTYLPGEASDHASAPGHNHPASSPASQLTHSRSNLQPTVHSINHKDPPHLNNSNLSSQTPNSTSNPQSVSLSRCARSSCLPHLVVNFHPFVPPFTVPTGVQYYFNGLVHPQSIVFGHLLTHWQWARLTSSMTVVWKPLVKIRTPLCLHIVPSASSTACTSPNAPSYRPIKFRGNLKS